MHSTTLIYKHWGILRVVTTLGENREESVQSSSGISSWDFRHCLRWNRWGYFFSLIYSYVHSYIKNVIWLWHKWKRGRNGKGANQLLVMMSLIHVFEGLVLKRLFVSIRFNEFLVSERRKPYCSEYVFL